MHLLRRSGKLAAFFAGAPPPAPILVPFPWATSPRGTVPYHVGNPLETSADRESYARRYRIDSDGVPYRHCEAEPPQYSPLVVARYALKQLAIAAAATAPEEAAAARARACSVLDALRRSGQATGAWGNGPASDAMTSETASAMVQGVVISALVRLVDGRPDDQLAELLDRAFDRIWTSVESGGTRSALEGGAFLEEFPRRPPSHILNGCVYGLFGLYDLADALSHDGARRAAAHVESTLDRAIARFDAPLGWSRYALDVYGHAPLASVHYHAAHVALVRVVALRSGGQNLTRAAQRWDVALRSAGRRIAVAPAKVAQVLWMRYLRRLPLQEG